MQESTDLFAVRVFDVSARLFPTYVQCDTRKRFTNRTDVSTYLYRLISIDTYVYFFSLLGSTEMIDCTYQYVLYCNDA